MYWRILTLINVLTVAAFAYKTWGQEAAWTALAVLGAILVPLSEIERRLAALLKRGETP